MCCLANFMQESTATKTYPAQYMDEAIDIYSLVSKYEDKKELIKKEKLDGFRLPVFATRCALMSTEILKAKEAYDQAVQQFLKLSQEVKSIVLRMK